MLKIKMRLNKRKYVEEDIKRQFKFNDLIKISIYSIVNYDEDDRIMHY
jgi:hypothetical protein